MFLFFVINTLFAQNHFNYNSTVPNQSLVEEIQYLCSELKEASSIIIEGHTDVRGSDSYNLRLSKKRADIAKKLIECYCKVSADIIKVVPMGKNFPISLNHDLNRRIVVYAVTPQKTQVFVIKEERVEQVSNKWLITPMVMYGHYDLSVKTSGNNTKVFLERSFSGGILLQRRLTDEFYLGGGGSTDGQVMLSLTFGFGR